MEVIDELPIWSVPFGLKLLDVVDYKPTISAIDIGFGTGFPLIELAMRFGNTSTRND
jgi:16S rRNA G527 N7-methylase RsmG